MNESEDKTSLGMQILGCAIIYVLGALALALLIGQPWMPRPGRIVIAVLLLLGLVAFLLVVIINLLGRWLGLSGPEAETGPPSMRFVRVFLWFYMPILRIKRRLSKPLVDTRPSVKTLIQEAALEGTTELDLSERLLESLPDELWTLTHLKELVLFGNLLTHLTGIGRLINLTELLLSDNNLAALPLEFSNLKKLDTLFLGENQFSMLPPQVTKLTNLRELDVSRNLIISLSPTIRNLRKLGDLNLGSNEMTELPPAIGELTCLRSLGLDNNHLTSLPAEIGNLSNLESLYLSLNELTTVPPEIGKLTNLTLLNLSHNPLNSIPPEVLKLPGTTVIVVDKQQVEAMPELKDRPNVKVV